MDKIPLFNLEILVTFPLHFQVSYSICGLSFFLLKVKFFSLETANTCADIQAGHGQCLLKKKKNMNPAGAKF